LPRPSRPVPLHIAGPLFAAGGAALTLLLVNAAPAAYGKRRVNWQYSVTPSVQLGVRDKFGEKGSYNAVFHVTMPDRKTVRATRKVSAAGFGYVTFPQDFNADVPTGRYTWRCVVGGEVAVQGRFDVKYSNGTSTLSFTD
jgi:hypothetical protein